MFRAHGRWNQAGPGLEFAPSIAGYVRLSRESNLFELQVLYPKNLTYGTCLIESSGGMDEKNL